MTTTREGQLEAALKLAKSCHGKMLLTHPPKEAWKYHRVDEVIDAALSTTDTDPQGYVEGLEDLLRWNVQGGALVSHDEGRLVLYADIVHTLFARPDQPAADTPALNDELATMISDLSHTGELSMLYRMEIADRITDLLAITATPAPSDKIAEAARVVPISLLRKLNKLSGYVHENEIRQIIGEHEK